MPYDKQKFELIEKELGKLEKGENDLKFRMRFLFFLIAIVIILIVFVVLFFFDNMIQELISISGVTAGLVFVSYFQLSKWLMEFVNNTKELYNNFFDNDKMVGD